jgi:hypothetical protein
VEHVETTARVFFLPDLDVTPVDPDLWLLLPKVPVGEEFAVSGAAIREPGQKASLNKVEREDDKFTPPFLDRASREFASFKTFLR